MSKVLGKSHVNWQDLALVSSTIVARFWNKVNKGGADACWLWNGAITGNNHYGSLRIGPKRGPTKNAHIVSWLIHFGRIPANMRVLHKCDTPLCVNPAHLWLGTCLENVQDMHLKGRYVNANKLRSVCKYGHKLDGIQIYRDKGKGKHDGKYYRYCLTCARSRKAAQRELKKSA